MIDGSVEIQRVSFEGLRARLTEVFRQAGVIRHNAGILADNCARCERDGVHSHGIFRIPGYLGSLESGWVDGRAQPRVEQAGDGYLRVDAANGFAQPALDAARSQIEDSLARSGHCIVAIRDSHHFSALWPDLEPFAEAGYVGFTTVTGVAHVVPPGGHTPVFGTNPIAFATPVAEAPPLIFDQATSTMAHGDLQIAAREGKTVPMGTGVDRSGNASDSPESILEGGLSPFGGHKGGSIALMVEILASALTGGQFSSEVDLSGHPGAQTPRTGQFLLLIDPARGDNAAFARRVAGLLEAVRSAGQSRLPGERRLRHRRDAERHGIPITRQDWEALAK
ncbi:Ldh family oxidoreductase [Halomonas sp. M4R1S46]|uniref:Ldh family oxidoreductase n=1 Tax=Halomonas sp. M4R1S46 TaxID=2982692 RepID=UPI0021E498F2|nr:Ldh family oxidoreductase [Halomonas sp. M4R1S46]UYG09006.1 Ldh family oxidoreductase [Halomonas sp. M4R1S46]